MQKQKAVSNIYALVAALKSCTRARDIEEGKKLHAHAIQIGHDSNNFVASTLVDMYAKCGKTAYARQLFDGMPHHDVVSWNCMLTGYVQTGENKLALELYAFMQNNGYVPSVRTFVALVNACANLSVAEEATQINGKLMKVKCLEKGVTIHSQATSCGYETDIFLATAVMDMYSKCGSMVDAWRVFYNMPSRTTVFWNCIIMGFAMNGEGGFALNLFSSMQDEGCTPDHVSFLAAMKACSNLAEQEEGKDLKGETVKIGCLQRATAIHCKIAEIGIESDIFLASALIDVYAKCASMRKALQVFDKMSRHDVVSWTAMIMGYAGVGEGSVALQFYSRMQDEGCIPNNVTFMAALKACGSLAALETGKMIHGEINRSNGNVLDIFVATSLVDMYAKCGSMVDAEHVFSSIPTKNLATWNALITGYSRLGDANHVFELVEKMQKENVKPNDVTFLSILTACTHAGLVEKGKQYFRLMRLEYGISPGIEHYTCMADLFGRANQLNEAVQTVQTMPFKPLSGTWITILGACVKWKNAVIGRLAFVSLLKQGCKDSAVYTLMANVYGRLGLWEESAEIHAMRKNAHVWKKPGESRWTDPLGNVHTFIVGQNARHPQYDDIKSRLQGLVLLMKDHQGYVADVSSVLWNLSIDEKEEALCGHSEKLAIACALINTAPGTTIRIVKNIRSCDDCHRTTAIISKMEQRLIICRDVSRYHIFKEGKCSCGNFW